MNNYIETFTVAIMMVEILQASFTEFYNYILFIYAWSKNVFEKWCSAKVMKWCCKYKFRREVCAYTH